MIDTLPALTSSSERATRTIARCHEKLAHQRRRLVAAERAPQRRATAIERAIGATFCVIYAAAVIFNAIRILAHA